ncbi:MAG: single-stranded-DNA-specific exonuclease RecJ [Firmicutes bacterium]|nr:single-stranded-DNA-specific exonuclease RecJ [Bacillota bacterium]
MTEKIWKYKNSKIPAGKAEDISKRLSVPKIIVTILLNREIQETDIEPFLKKSLKSVINPMLLPDMDKAAERILSAADKGEKITVYGDYDVDGITAAALLYDFLCSIGANVQYYIPDRRDEGYGINIMAVNKLLKSGTKLLVTVDCGITAKGEVSFAKLQGMDVIITDHHTCPESLPSDAAAVVNPKIPDCGYPFDALAGVGVAFKLALAISIKKGINTTACFNRYADLAAIGTIADVVSLTGENRVIVDRGLKLLATPRRPGLKALFEVAGILGKPVTSTSIAYNAAPRLNAAGRIGSAKTSVELLLTNDEAKAKEIAEALNEINRERQATEQQIFSEALKLTEKDADFSKKKVIVLASESWHNGVIGIVASKLCERFYRPCILISLSDGIGKGSGRSIPEFNLFDALDECKELLTEFGGHSAAAGLNINESDIDEFSKKINKYADKALADKTLLPSVNIDCEINAEDLTLENAYMLERLEPFGMGNEKPLFSISAMTVTAIYAVGAEKKHLRLQLAKNNIYIYAIAFGMGELADVYKISDTVDAAFELNINRFQGQESVQLIIKDLKRN